MTRPRPSLLLCIGMFLLASAPATPLLALAPSGHGHRAMIGLLPLEVAQIQRDADYNREGRNAYFNPTYGLIALGIGAIIGLTWFLGAEPASRLRGDPMPSRIRNRLDLLDNARLEALAAVRAGKSRGLDLTKEKALYDQLARDVGEVLDKMRRDLLLNIVDEAYLAPALDALDDRARSLSARLRRLAPVPSSMSYERNTVPFRHGALARITRSWERVFSRDPAKMTTIRELNAMRWPSWSRIETSPCSPE